MFYSDNEDSNSTWDETAKTESIGSSMKASLPSLAKQQSLLYLDSNRENSVNQTGERASRMGLSKERRPSRFFPENFYTTLSSKEGEGPHDDALPPWPTSVSCSSHSSSSCSLSSHSSSRSSTSPEQQGTQRGSVLSLKMEVPPGRARVEQLKKLFSNSANCPKTSTNYQKGLEYPSLAVLAENNAAKFDPSKNRTGNKPTATSTSASAQRPSSPIERTNPAAGSDASSCSATATTTQGEPPRSAATTSTTTTASITGDSCAGGDDDHHHDHDDTTSSEHAGDDGNTDKDTVTVTDMSVSSTTPSNTRSPPGVYKRRDSPQALSKPKQTWSSPSSASSCSSVSSSSPSSPVLLLSSSSSFSVKSQAQEQETETVHPSTAEIEPAAGQENKQQQGSEDTMDSINSNNDSESKGEPDMVVRAAKPDNTSQQNIPGNSCPSCCSYTDGLEKQLHELQEREVLLQRAIDNLESRNEKQKELFAEALEEREVEIKVQQAQLDILVTRIQELNGDMRTPSMSEPSENDSSALTKGSWSGKTIATTITSQTSFGTTSDAQALPLTPPMEQDDAVSDALERLFVQLHQAVNERDSMIEENRELMRQVALLERQRILQEQQQPGVPPSTAVWKELQQLQHVARYRKQQLHALQKKLDETKEDLSDMEEWGRSEVSVVRQAMEDQRTKYEQRIQTMDLQIQQLSQRCQRHRQQQQQHDEAWRHQQQQQQRKHSNQQHSSSSSSTRDATTSSGEGRTTRCSRRVSQKQQNSYEHYRLSTSPKASHTTSTFNTSSRRLSSRSVQSSPEYHHHPQQQQALRSSSPTGPTSPMTSSSSSHYPSSGSRTQTQDTRRPSYSKSSTVSTSCPSSTRSATSGGNTKSSKSKSLFPQQTVQRRASGSTVTSRGSPTTTRQTRLGRSAEPPQQQPPPQQWPTLEASLRPQQFQQQQQQRMGYFGQLDSVAEETSISSSSSSVQRHRHSVC